MILKSTDSHRAIISEYVKRRNEQPDTSSKAWLDWCYVWSMACKNLPAGIKRRVDAGQFDYEDFKAIWKATSEERKNGHKMGKAV